MNNHDCYAVISCTPIYKYHCTCFLKVVYILWKQGTTTSQLVEVIIASNLGPVS